MERCRAFWFDILITSIKTIANGKFVILQHTNRAGEGDGYKIKLLKKKTVKNHKKGVSVSGSRTHGVGPMAILHKTTDAQTRFVRSLQLHVCLAFIHILYTPPTENRGTERENRATKTKERRFTCATKTKERPLTP